MWEVSASLTDEQLFAAWVDGDRASGAALIERYYAAVERFFLSKVGDRADDLVQQTLLACIESAASFRGVTRFRAYLFGVARNVLCDFIRRRTRDGQPPPDFGVSSIMDLMPGIATQAAQRAEERQLILALRQLPLDLQMLVELYYWEEISVDELAQMMEVPPGTIKSRLHRARTLLSEAMVRLPAEPDDSAGATTLLRQWIEKLRSDSQ
jgi:RNA polymerase sigma-70 factor (ECF subfamily)